MTEAATLIGILDKCLAVIGLIRDGKVRRDEKIDAGLHALHTALCETKAYVTRLNDGDKRDRQHEHKIANLWHYASVPLRHVDPGLADRCFIKGSYWLEPDVWTEAQVQANRIALNQVHKSIRELLLRYQGGTQSHIFDEPVPRSGGGWVSLGRGG